MISKPTETAIAGSQLRGPLLMVAGFGLYSVSDTIGKILSSDYHPVQIVLIRQLGLIMGLVVLLALRGRTILSSKAPRLQIMRGTVAVISGVSFVFAISYVPLADAVAVTFVAPFMVTVLGALVLREPVGLRRWIAVVIGFIGAVIIIRPGLGAFQPAILFAVLAAFAFALRQVISRLIGSTDPTHTTVAYTGLTSVSLLALAVPFFWVWPQDPATVMLMILLAITAGAGEFLLIKALEISHAVVLAPMHYSLIIFSTFWGYAVFHYFPDGWTWLGSAIIIGSGLYTILREQKSRPSARNQATPPE